MKKPSLVDIEGVPAVATVRPMTEANTGLKCDYTGVDRTLSSTTHITRPHLVVAAIVDGMLWWNKSTSHLPSDAFPENEAPGCWLPIVERDELLSRGYPVGSGIYLRHYLCPAPISLPPNWAMDADEILRLQVFEAEIRPEVGGHWDQRLSGREMLYSRSIRLTKQLHWDSSSARKLLTEYCRRILPTLSDVDWEVAKLAFAALDGFDISEGGEHTLQRALARAQAVLRTAREHNGGHGWTAESGELISPVLAWEALCMILSPAPHREFDDICGRIANVAVGQNTRDWRTSATGSSRTWVDNPSADTEIAQSAQHPEVTLARLNQVGAASLTAEKAWQNVTMLNHLYSGSAIPDSLVNPDGVVSPPIQSWTAGPLDNAVESANT